MQQLYHKVIDGSDQNIIIEVQPQIGKLLSHDTLVPTPLGFIRHGDLVSGDFVFHPSGNQIQVLGLSKEDFADVEITFLNGAKVICHKNHEWYVFDHSQHKYRTIETKELLTTDLGEGSRSSTYRFKLDYNQPLKGEDSEIIIDPYVLGAWLGDGKSTGTVICHHPEDNDVIDQFEKRGYKKTNVYTHKTTGILQSEFKQLLPQIRFLGIYGNKRIPENYFLASVLSRRELLCGLMDTDGTVDDSRGYNRFYFSNTNEAIIKGVVRLIRSLGYRASVTRIEPCLSSSGIQGIKPVFNISFSIHDGFIPFKMERKIVKCKYQAVRRRNSIVSVKIVDKVKGRCVQVDSPDGLYLITEHLVPTHNSTTCSELFPAWVLGKSHLDTGEGWPIICASYGASLAEQKSQNCRDLVNSEIFQMIFPETRLHPETAAKDFWKTTTGGSYRAVGVGGGLAGMPGKLLIADDLFKDRADADSETVRESTWKWWQAIFMSRKQDPSGVTLVNTRWHRGDIAGRLEAQLGMDQASKKKEWEYDHWETLSFPAFAEQDEYLDGVLFRKSGEVLCPERFSYEAMVRRRNATVVYEWSAMYMQRPILKENAKFTMEWFRYYETEDIKFKQLNWYVLVDLASSKKQGADNTVAMVVGKERDTGYWFVDDYISGHLDPGQTIDAIFLLVKNHPGAKVYIEAQGYQSTLQYHVEEKQRKDQVFFVVEPLTQKASKSKEARIEGLIQPFKLGTIYHRRWMKLLESELLEFPQGKHDDHPDALAMAQQVMPHTAVSESPEEKQARQEEEKVGFDPHRAFNRI